MSATEFPHDLLPSLRCSSDGASLVFVGKPREGAAGIIEASLRCTNCGFIYRIEDGIARMLLGDGLTVEDHHELQIREAEYACNDGEPFVPPPVSWRSELNDLIEIPPLLKVLGRLQNRRVLEFGCGDGRLTMLMAQLGAQVLAVDFSLNALKRMAAWLPAGIPPTTYRARSLRSRDLRPQVGLVQANASRFCVSPKSFDRALSATPLDSREERMSMYRTIAESLTDNGCYIGGFEHDDLIRRLLGLPLARRYERGGIFIEHFGRAAIRNECAPYFSKLNTRCIRPRFPLANRLPTKCSVLLTRIIEAMPYLTDMGEIVLVVAEKPVRPPIEGASRSGHRLARAIFRQYTRQLGNEPVWGDDIVV